MKFPVRLEWERAFPSKFIERTPEERTEDYTPEVGSQGTIRWPLQLSLLNYLEYSSVWGASTRRALNRCGPSSDADTSSQQPGASGARSRSQPDDL